MITSPRHQGETSEWADANWRAVLEAAPDAMLVVNRTGEIVAANQQATKLYGYSREHLIGRVVESLIPGRLRDRHRQHRENFFANSEMPTMQVIEIFAVRSDASEIPVDVSLSHLTIGTETFAISVVRDATGRVRAEELKRSETILRESEQRFRLAAQAGKMYAYEWDVATDMVMRSEEHVSVLGFSQPRRLTRQELLARVHPEDHPLFVGSVGHLTPQNPTTQISYRVSRPDGSVVWLEKSARGFFDDQGKLLRVIGMVANVTERKRAEEALRESEARYEQLAEQSRTTNWEVDPKGRFTYVSHVPQASWGYRPDEVVGQMHFYDIHPEEGREAFKAAVFAAVERKQSFRDVVHAVETKDGRISWGSTNGVPVLNGDGTLRGYRGSCTDITERKRAEETLRESEEKFRSVFRDAGAGMVIVSPEGRFLAANKAFCDTLGYTEEELQEKTVESVTLSEDWPAFSKKLREALTEGRGFQWFEKRCLHKSGRIVYTASSTSLIRSRNGEPQYFVGEVLLRCAKRQSRLLRT